MAGEGDGVPIGIPIAVIGEGTGTAAAPDSLQGLSPYQNLAQRRLPDRPRPPRVDTVLRPHR